MELTQLSASDLAKGYRAKEFSAVDVIKTHLTRIETENPKLNAFLEVFDDVLASAKEADNILSEKGSGAHALMGIPIAVKDNILIKGKIASAASKILENHKATYDATVISKLKKAGAIFLGRTNMDEFAMGSSTESSAFGPTRNPYDLERVPGGSSGGSAAAVAAHLAPLALGSDTGCSVRQPAAFCGIFGLKPTYGTVSRSGLIAMGSSLDQIGPLARTVSDTELLFNTIRGKDPLDAAMFEDGGEVVVSGKKIGVPRAFIKDASEGMRDVFEKTLEKLSTSGYEIVDIELPYAPYSLAAYYVIIPAEVSANLARFDGMRYGLSVEGKTLLDEYQNSRTKGFGPEPRRRIILGAYVLSSGYYDAYYRRATALRGLIVQDFQRAFESVSFVAMPTSPGPAFKIGEKSDPLSMYLEDVFTTPANITGLPSLSVPAGMVEREGKQLPIGIQFMSLKRSEGALFRVARDVVGENHT